MGYLTIKLSEDEQALRDLDYRVWRGKKRHVSLILTTGFKHMLENCDEKEIQKLLLKAEEKGVSS